MTRSVLVLALLGSLFGACDDKEPKKNPFEGPAKTTVEPPKDAAPPAPKGPPELSIDDLGPKIGFTRVLLDKPEGRDRLAKELADTKEYWDGKEASVAIDRKSKMAWVVAFVQELAKVGVSKVVIKTETRKEYPADLAFTPLSKIGAVEPCALAGMILDDRSTAIWKVAGGMAMKRSKGLAGPDLSTTGETIERLQKGCPHSNVFFVSADDSVEWGLCYDLAATTKKIDVKFDNIVLLEKTPVAGRKVEIGK